MGVPEPRLTWPARGRLAAVAAAVFLANAGLLVLQLCAGRLLAPFVGSSLETWTVIIGTFLAGIALGNAVGGRIADRFPTGRMLALTLAVGALSAGWMLAFPIILSATDAHRLLPLAPRIPVLAVALCFPAGVALSLPTPLAIRIGLPDVRRAGRVAGLVFSLGTLGCLAGNYLAGFYLIPNLTVNAIVASMAVAMLATSGFAALTVRTAAPVGVAGSKDSSERQTNSRTPPLPLPRAYVIVFLASFTGMTLELSGVRLMAQIVGVSLYTWTGVIGVMLAGTALGNWLGGQIADRAGRSADAATPFRVLSGCLVASAVAITWLLYGFVIARGANLFLSMQLILVILAYTFLLFFPAMLALGTVSPQVVRLAVPDVAHAGRVAGRVYAWSTAGAIAGTFATGYLLISQVGTFRTILIAAALPGGLAMMVFPVWQRAALLYPLSLATGTVAVAAVVFSPGYTGIAKETNYYTIRVDENVDPEPLESPTVGVALAGAAGQVAPPGNVLTLRLDLLIHSRVMPADPTYIHYDHEQVQLEILRLLKAARPERQRVLVIGGGGYTFPRAARTLIPSAAVDVVEIDPGVTEVAVERLGLDPAWGIRTVNEDGRQFLAEQAAPASYDLILLDAVNDLSVPAHLLTKEFNEAVRRTLTPDGVYLLTVIDEPQRGRLWRAAFHTLKRTFPHVRLVMSHKDYSPWDRNVMVLYASANPLDEVALSAELTRQGIGKQFTHAVPPDVQDGYLGFFPPVVLTDQFAPVDNLMAEVFRRRHTP